MSDVDVVVVGSGAAGLAAAATAGSAGARVLVAESETEIGGSSRLSDAFLMAAGTSVQRRDGISDSADAMFEYYMALNRWQVEPGLARALCGDSAGVIEWLLGLGVAFGPVERAGREPVWRGHLVQGNGDALIAALTSECRRSGVDLAVGNRVDDLVVDDDGVVCGVRARGEAITADAVVLASGGFTRSSALIRRHLAGRMLAGDSPVTPSGIGSRGDALVMGEALGAAIVGQDRAHWVPGPLVPGQVVLVNRQGRRFIDESADHSVRTGVAAYHGHTYWAVFDEGVRRTRPLPPFAARTSPAMLFHDGALDERDESIAAWRLSGRLVSGATVEEASRVAGLDGAAVAGTIRRYNDACRAGRDVSFDKDHSMLVALEQPPFHLMRVEPFMLVATFCGLCIDAEAAVVGIDGRRIDGLFAAGECTGGVVGEIYAGHGNALMNGLVFGRRAGAHAAQLARGQ